MKAVITAAGLGSRFLPMTKALPKIMLPVYNKPMIDWVLDECLSGGVRDIMLILAPTDKISREYITQEWSGRLNIEYEYQHEPLGQGHAMLMAKTFVNNEAFLSIAPDDIVMHEKPLVRQLVEKYEKYQCSLCAVERVGIRNISRYGIISAAEFISDRVYRITDMREKPRWSVSDLAIIGRYVLEPTIFADLESRKFQEGEINVTDSLLRLARDSNVLAYEYEGQRFDCGTPQALVDSAYFIAGGSHGRV